MKADFSPQERLEFIKIALWLWDQYEDDEKMRKAIGKLVHYVHYDNFPRKTAEALSGLCDYINMGRDTHPHESHDLSKSTLASIRSGYEQDIQSYFGTNGLEMTMADQPLIADLSGRILESGWNRLAVLYRLYLVLRLFEEKVSEHTPELTDVMEHVAARIATLEENDK